MYETYETLFDWFVSEKVVRAVETVISADMLRLIGLCMVSYYVAAFVRYGSQLVGQQHLGTKPRRVISISPLWQIATLAMLTTNLHLRIILAS